MGCKSVAALFRYGVRCIGLAAYELLERGDVAGSLKRLKVGGQVAVSNTEQLLQADKVIAVIGGQHRHYTQADTVLEQLVVTVHHQYRTLFSHGS